MSWQSALERTVTGLGYDLVDVERSVGGLLRVTIDRLPGQSYGCGPGESVLVEDCEMVTRQLQLVLEVEPLEYERLEVSSPGLDRPLKKLSDWQRFVGVEIEITLREKFQDRRKWRGVLAAGESDSQWRLLLPPERVGAPPKKGARISARALALAAAQPQQAMDFGLDEVREARLVPVVDFKGRQGQAVGLGDAPSAGPAGPVAGQEHAAHAQVGQVDGGQD